MIPIPNNITRDDVHQWLNNGVFIAELGTRREPTPVRYETCSRDSITYITADGSSSGRVARSRSFAHWPACGALNMPGGYAIDLVRAPSRQYRRTYNPRALSVVVPFSWQVANKLQKGASLVSSPMHQEVILEAFDPTYFSYSECLERIQAGAFSCAMSPHTIVFEGENGLGVLYRGDVIGYVDEDRRFHVAQDFASAARRILKLFDGRVELCISDDSR